MSLVILAAALLAAAACWHLPAVTWWPRPPRFMRRPSSAAVSVSVSGHWPWWGASGHRPAAGSNLDGHVEAIRQIAALLRSGRPPAEAWELLEATWNARLASGVTDGRAGGSPLRRGGGAGAGFGTAARDIVEACRAARIAHETGAGPSAGIERHLRTAPTFRHAWDRLGWCIRLSESTGAPLGDLLNRLAGQLEAEQDRRRALEATLAGPRMTQKLLAWLPALGLGLAQLMGADPLVLLTGTTTGRMCLVCGAALWWANAVWCRRLLASAEPAGAGRKPRRVAQR